MKNFFFIMIALVALISCGEDKNMPVTHYTITFETDGGTPVPTAQSVEAGGTASAPAINPTKTGYVFLYWQLNGATGAYNFQLPVNSNITLTAKWQEEAIVEYWQVTWELNGGAWPVGDNHAVQVVKGGALSEPIEPVKNSYTFEGWYKEPTLTNKVLFPYDVSSVTGDFMLYAKWESEGGSSPADSPYAKLAEGLYKVNGENYTTIQVVDSDPDSDTFITDAFTWVKANSNGTSSTQAEYVLVLDAKTYNTKGGANVLETEFTTLTVYGKQAAIIQITNNGLMFSIGGLNKEGIKFLLDGNLTMKGITGNNTVVLSVSFGAVAEMKSNTKITGNSNTSLQDVGGVSIYEATFIMDDHAEISGCNSTASSYIINGITQKISIMGGGVSVSGGYNPTEISAYLVMRGNSTIKNNTVTNNGAIKTTFAEGGGVYLGSYSELIMEDNSTITGNTAKHNGGGTARGGGVYVGSNSTVSQKDSSKIENNTPDNIYRY